MKNKQINKFLFMFIIGFSLLFSTSLANADIFTDSVRLTSDANFGVIQSTSNLSVLGLSYNATTFNSTMNNFYSSLRNDSTYTDARVESMIDELIGKANSYYAFDYDSYFFVGYSSTSFYLFVFNSDDVDIALQPNGRPCFSLVEGSSYLAISRVSSSQTNVLSYKNVSSGYYRSVNSSTIGMKSDLSIKALTSFESDSVNGGNIAVWDGKSYYYKAEPDIEIPTFTDDEIANVINIFLASEDLATTRPSGYDDYYIVYNLLENKYYAYLYKSFYDLGMHYGNIDENGNFEINGLEEGSAYRIFWHQDINGFLEELWANIKRFFIPTKYFVFEIMPEKNTCSYKETSTKESLIYLTIQDYIVYTSKDINLYLRDGENVVLDVSGSILKEDLKNSETNEDYVFEMPETTIAETPYRSFISNILAIPEKLVSTFQEMTGLTKIITMIYPIGSAIFIILNVLLSSISLLARAVTFVYTLPTIDASDALFLVDVDAITGLSFTGYSWGTRFLEGLNFVKELSWNGLNPWTLFTSFIVALFAIYCVKLVRRHYHY